MGPPGWRRASLARRTADRWDLAARVDRCAARCVGSLGANRGHPGAGGRIGDGSTDEHADLRRTPARCLLIGPGPKKNAPSREGWRAGYAPRLRDQNETKDPMLKLLAVFLSPVCASVSTWLNSASRVRFLVSE